LYLPTVGWAALVVALAVSVDRCLNGLALAMIVGLVAIGVYGTRLQTAPWKQAAELRDRVEAAAQADRRMKACQQIAVANLPDSVRGAYVFRNGAREAFGRDLHLDVTTGASPGPCSFRWDPVRLAFAR
jgi:hypothetical protein